MKLTTEQEALLDLLVQVEELETEKYYKKSELLYKIGDLGLEENGFDWRDELERLRALEDNGLIKFEYEELDEEDIEVYDLEVLEAGREYIEQMRKSNANEKKGAKRSLLDSVNVKGSLNLGLATISVEKKDKEQFLIETGQGDIFKSLVATKRTQKYVIGEIYFF